MNQRGILIKHLFRPRVSQLPLPGLFKFYHREGRRSTFTREKMSDAESDSEFAFGNICKYQNRMNPLLTLGFASGASTILFHHTSSACLFNVATMRISVNENFNKLRRPTV